MPHAIFYPTTLLRLPPGKGWNTTYVSDCPSLFCVSNDKPCAHTSRPIYTTSAPNDAIPLPVVPFEVRIVFGTLWGRLPPKAAQKRPSKGKFKPKQKFRKIEATLDCVYWYSPNFTAMRGKIVCTRWFMKKMTFSKIQDGGGRHLGFRNNVNNFCMDKAILTKF